MKTTIYNIALTLLILSFASCSASQSNFIIGKQYYDEGNFEQAIIELEKASRNDTSIYDRISAFEYLGDVYTRKGNLERAVLSYKNAYELIRMRIAEIMDRRKALKGEKPDDPSFGSNLQGKSDKLYDEQSKLNLRAQEVQIKIEHLK